MQLAERQIGRVRLAVDFQQRLPEKAQADVTLPLVQAEDVEYQSAFVAVEGDRRTGRDASRRPARGASMWARSSAARLTKSASA